ncbi:MAG: 1-deoxy-D-xylulose-5-phosphate reductoisomerase [Actinomycetota bacterium]
MPRRVVILGSTGSIGVQTIDVIQTHPEHFAIVGLVAGSDAQKVEHQARELGVTHYGVGAESARALAALEEADVVVNGIVGAAGLEASIAALRAGKLLALANKESLVAGGEVCLRARDASGGSIVPIDSEHAAIAQCLEGRDPATVARIVLTASGGPFRTRTDLNGVTPRQALAHPTWSMGPKITIDSATLMNKGLEAIEAHHLFGFDYDHIGVVVHPQSVVHGIVELVDGSMLMQAAPTDMRIPIQAALTWPERLESPAAPVSLTEVGSLEFEAVDDARFPAVRLAYQAGRNGRSYPAALNAANEVAVGAFLDNAISFTDIPRIIEQVLESHAPVDASELEAVLAVDAWARDEAHRRIGSVPETAGVSD